MTADEAVSKLQRLATKQTLEGMARYAIPSDNAFGVAVGDIRKVAKLAGRDHTLALALWDKGWYEARMLAAFVDDPKLVTSAQMDRWCRDFDSWAICDTICFHLFDRTPHAWKKVAAWRKRTGEFQKRAAFSLLASLALHDKKSDDEPFAEALPYIEAAANDERNFVKKGVNWALRAIGRRGPHLNALATALARKLAASDDKTERWVGKDALRDLTRKLKL
jgi:3-methyladenine DNA glycosylase AlkD